MKKWFWLVLFLSVALCVQAEDDTQEPDDSDSYYFARMNQAGDQYILIGINIEFPIKPDNLRTGGSGTLGYHRFLSSVIAVGFDVCFGYAPTIGNNVYTYIPFIFSLTYQPTLRRFEFPITMGVGFAVENYMDNSYFPGLVLKPELGAFFRITPSWSLGVEGNYIWMPQWYKDVNKRQYNYSKGAVSGVGIAMRYHF